jgi:hypothetical protein
MGKVTFGPHTIEARDASNALVEQVAVDVTPGTYAILFAPKRSPEACFGIETAAYGTNEEPHFDGLSTTRTLYELPMMIDNWFVGNPDPSQVQLKPGTAKHLRAVRMRPCEEVAKANQAGIENVLKSAQAARFSPTGAAPSASAEAPPAASAASAAPEAPPAPSAAPSAAP